MSKFCIDVARTGRHWYIYKKHYCGPATLVCQRCGHEIAA